MSAIDEFLLGPLSQLRGRCRYALGLGLRVLYATNLLDLTTSAVFTLTTQAYLGEQRSRWAAVAQYALVLPSALWLARRFPAWLRALAALPLPRRAQVAVGGFFLIHLAHVALQAEHFPFTNVGMFTYLAPEWSGAQELGVRYLVPDEAGHPTVFSLRRMGDYFQRTSPGVDHQEALIYTKFPTHPLIYRRVAEHCKAAGLPVPVPAHVRLALSPDGPRLENIRPLIRLPGAPP